MAGWRWSTAPTAREGAPTNRPPGSAGCPPSTVHRPPSTVHRPPSTVHRPPSTVHRPPGERRLSSGQRERPAGAASFRGAGRQVVVPGGCTRWLPADGLLPMAPSYRWLQAARSSGAGGAGAAPRSVSCCVFASQDTWVWFLGVTVTTGTRPAKNGGLLPVATNQGYLPAVVVGRHLSSSLRSGCVQRVCSSLGVRPLK